MSNASFAKVGAEPKAVADIIMNINPETRFELLKCCFKTFLPYVVSDDWTYYTLGGILHPSIKFKKGS